MYFCNKKKREWLRKREREKERRWGEGCKGARKEEVKEGERERD